MHWGSSSERTLTQAGKRANFINIQLGHQLPTKEGEVSRIRTGFERVIAHRSSTTYSTAAKMNGKVVAVDEDTNIIKVQYIDGTTQTILYGEQHSQCSDMWVTQKMELTVKLGDSFKKGDILCFNNEYFQKDPFTRQVDWKHGVHANVALIDNNKTYEDSSTITEALGEKLQVQPVEVRTITLTKNTFIHEIAKEGQVVGVNDFLMIFEDATIAESIAIDGNKDSNQQYKEALAQLAELNRSTPRANAAGKIVKMDAFYSCPISEMHPTLAKVVRDCVKMKNTRSKFSRGALNEANHSEASVLAKGTKFRGVLFEEDTVVIQFFIQESINATTGDKLVLDSSLKSVISYTLDSTPVTESGVEIDVLFGATSVSNRIVNSPVLVGGGERVMEKLEQDCLDMYFGT